MSDDEISADEDATLSLADHLCVELATLRAETAMLRNGVAALLLLVSGRKLTVDLPKALGVHADGLMGVTRTSEPSLSAVDMTRKH